MYESQTTPVNGYKLITTNYKLRTKNTMAHPKRRHSSTRRDKRRTHYKATAVTLSTDATTGEVHERHHAHVFEGNLFYKGKMVIEGYAPAV